MSSRRNAWRSLVHWPERQVPAPVPVENRLPQLSTSVRRTLPLQLTFLGSRVPIAAPEGTIGGIEAQVPAPHWLFVVQRVPLVDGVLVSPPHCLLWFCPPYTIASTSFQSAKV